MTFFGILALAMVALVVFRGTDDQRFIRSAAEMEAFARTMRDGERLGPRTVGGMKFEQVRRERGVVVFQRGERLFSPYGYAWSPQGDPFRLLEDVEWSEDHVDHYFEHLEGAFYSWDGRR
ncbi:hypothetical protein [Nonomuraea jiangxiensis]|uniref:hypothetical protein n=1 Tax=Nonomuraea jiangxiensis TaxID=633440 RepID=UPI000B877E93|nr:hypothetical protein [Nonomuraea jiangxiensis]